MEESSRHEGVALLSPIGRVPGLHDDVPLPAEALEAHPAPPPLPCRPLQGLPPPGVFLTTEGLSAFSVLGSLLNPQQTARPAPPAELLACVLRRARHSMPSRGSPAGPAASHSDSDSGSRGVVSSHLHAGREAPARQQERPQRVDSRGDGGLGAVPEAMLTQQEDAAPGRGNEEQQANAAGPAPGGAGPPATAAAAGEQQGAGDAGEVGLPRRATRSSTRKRKAGAAAAASAEEAAAAAGPPLPPPMQPRHQQQQQPQQEEKGSGQQGAACMDVDNAAAWEPDYYGSGEAGAALEAGSGPGEGQGIPEQEEAHAQGSSSDSDSDASMENLEGDEEDAAAVGEERAAVAAGRKTLTEAATAMALRKLGKESLEALLAEQAETAAKAGKRPRGGRGRGARGRGRGRKGGHVEDLVNPKASLHHPRFAKAFRAAMTALDKKQLKAQHKAQLREHGRLVKRWSALSEEEHRWYLEHQGQQLEGADAEKLGRLHELVDNEQREWLGAAMAALEPGRERYRQCTTRQEAQIDGDLRRRRERVRLLPRVYRLQELLPIQDILSSPAAPEPSLATAPAAAAAAGGAGATAAAAAAAAAAGEGGAAGVPGGLPAGASAPLELRHVSVLRQAGTLPVLACLPSGKTVPGQVHYLPATVSQPVVEPAAAAAEAGVASAAPEHCQGQAGEGSAPCQPPGEARDASGKSPGAAEPLGAVPAAVAAGPEASAQPAAGAAASATAAGGARPMPTGARSTSAAQQGPTQGSMAQQSTAAPFPRSEQDRPYSKVAPPELADDSTLAQLLRPLLAQRWRQQQQQQQQQQEQQQREQRQQEEGQGQGQGNEAPAAEVPAPAGGVPAAAVAAGPLGQCAMACLAASAFSCLANMPFRRDVASWEIPITVQEVAQEVPQSAGNGAGTSAHKEGYAQAAGQAAEPVQVERLAAAPAAVPPARTAAARAAAMEPPPPPPLSQPRVLFIGKPLVPRCLSMRAKLARLQKYAVLSLALWQAEAASQPAGPAVGAPGDATEPEAMEQQRQDGVVGAVAPAGAAAAAGGTAAGTPAAAAGATAGAALSLTLPPGVAPRHTSYDLWELGEQFLVVRSHDRAVLQPPAGEGGAGASKAAPKEQQQAQQEQEQPGEGKAGEGCQDKGAAAAAGTADYGTEAQDGPPAAAQQQGAAAGPAAAAAAQEGGEGIKEGQQGRLVVPVVKTSYLQPPEEEEFTMQELGSWWCKALLRPECDLMLTQVHVPLAKILSSDRLPAPSLREQLGQVDTQTGLRFLHGVLRTLRTLAPGRYVLAHAAKEPCLCLFKALPEELLGSEAPALDALPCSASVAQRGKLYDLHVAHLHSGEPDDPLDVPLVPPRWHAFNPAIPQVMYTFPPRPAGQRPGRGQQRPRKRQRAMLPYAWGVLGQGGDFDQVGHVGRISRSEYAQSLEEELE